MGKKNKIVAIKRKRNVSSRGRRPRAMSSLPPMLPMSRVFIRRQTFRLVRRMDVTPAIPWSENYTIKELLTNTAYKDAFLAFKQVKLHHLKVWIIPTLPVTVSGTHALVVCDLAENAFIEKDTVSEYAQMAGSEIRKVYQPLHLFWRPTQPKARNWIQFNTTDKDELFAISYVSADVKLGDGTTKKFTIDFVIDITMSFRGVNQIAIAKGETSLYDMSSHFNYDVDDQSDISLINSMTSVQMSTKRVSPASECSTDVIRRSRRKI
jgi:hypothetical protein